MSRRRRLVLLGGLVAVLLAAVVAAGLLLGRANGGGAAGGVAADRPGPVLLVPGYGGGTAGLEALAATLRAAGHEARVVPLPGRGTGDLDRQAVALDVAARAALAGGAPSVDVVGFSAGGVVARLWAAEHGGAARARRVVTLGSPHHGTDLAALAGALAPDSCPRACQQLAPDSDLLRGLNRGDETPAGPRWVSIWTAQDQVVSPPDSARLSGALDVVVQRVCPGRTVAHGGLPTDAVVGGLVVRALAAGPVTAPRRTDCAALAASG